MNRLLCLAALIGIALTQLAPLDAADASAIHQGARPLLSPIFGDHMVLQRDKPNTLWGWAAPGRAVTVSIADARAVAQAGPDGRWKTAIDVPPAGGPYTITVEAGERLVLDDVMVGDVWLCGGQSNIVLPLRDTNGADEELKRANQPQLRLCTIGSTVAYAPAKTVRASWAVCSTQSAAGFSAVGYYFATRLQHDVNVPIGVIQDGSGGSPAESWISPAALTRAGEFKPQLAEIARLGTPGAPTHGSFLMHWLDEHDVGGRGEAWAKPGFDDATWKTVRVPGGFAEFGVAATPAIVWFRREVTLPDPLPAGTARIQLGVVERMETVYLNGRWTGASSWVENPRNYAIPADALKPGRNVVALRVFKTTPDGGFKSPAAALRLVLGDGTAVPLAGEWKAALSYDARPPAAMPLDFDNYPTMPAVLYNGMISPVAPLAIAGAVWYQGEANQARAAQYRKLLPVLVADWREQFGQGDFPFYVISLPAFMARRTEPGTTDGWAEVRDAQIFTAGTVRNADVVITVDTGEADNIHPREKRLVGERAALCALRGHYGRAVEAHGPTLQRVERRGDALALHFDRVAAGLRVQGDKLGEFAIAGADRVWHWADARIEGTDVVVVSATEVPAPLFARYAWQANPLATLANSAGLPAAPFRTDD